MKKRGLYTLEKKTGDGLMGLAALAAVNFNLASRALITCYAVRQGVFIGGVNNIARDYFHSLLIVQRGERE